MTFREYLEVDMQSSKNFCREGLKDLAPESHADDWIVDERQPVDSMLSDTCGGDQVCSLISLFQGHKPGAPPHSDPTVLQG
nr:unnamed protein product [Spirometra erinaceieuropaei]